MPFVGGQHQWVVFWLPLLPLTGIHHCSRLKVHCIETCGLFVRSRMPCTEVHRVLSFIPVRNNLSYLLYRCGDIVAFAATCVNSFVFWTTICQHNRIAGGPVRSRLTNFDWQSFQKLSQVVGFAVLNVQILESKFLVSLLLLFPFLHPTHALQYNGFIWIPNKLRYMTSAGYWHYTV